MRVTVDANTFLGHDLMTTSSADAGGGHLYFQKNIPPTTTKYDELHAIDQNGYVVLKYVQCTQQLNTDSPYTA
jgi:hypothetical protein